MSIKQLSTKTMLNDEYSKMSTNTVCAGMEAMDVKKLRTRSFSMEKKKAKKSLGVFFFFP